MTAIHTWVIGILVTVLFGIVSTNQYWLNRSVVDLKTQVAVLNFTVLKTLPIHSAISPAPGKSDLLAVPLLPMSKFLSGYLLKEPPK